RRYDQFSKADADGTRRIKPVGAPRFSARCLNSCSTDIEKVSAKIPDATTATETWVISHQDCNAGWTLPTGVGKPMVAPIIINSTTPETKVPTKRRSLRSKNTRYTSEMTSAPEVMNSYRLPHGARDAATARATTANAWASMATTRMATPILAAGRLMPPVYSMSSETSCLRSLGSFTEGPEAPTSSFVLTVSSSFSSFLMDRDADAISQE